MTVGYKVHADGEGLLRLSVPGETLLYKVAGEDNDGAFDYFVLEIQPRTGPPLHRHVRQHETVHFLQGRYKVQVEDDVFICEEGGFVWFPIGTRHSFVNISDAPGRCVLTFTPGSTERFFEEFGPAVRGAEGEPDLAVIAEIFARHGWELCGPPLSPDEDLTPR